MDWQDESSFASVFDGACTGPCGGCGKDCPTKQACEQPELGCEGGELIVGLLLALAILCVLAAIVESGAPL
jgi:hypothetical protein